MSENPRRGRQARNFITNVPKILNLKSSSEQIFFRKLSLGAPNVVTRYMYDAVRRDFALSASFVSECFDGSELSRWRQEEGNELVVQKENCVVEEIKEVELRSRRGKFIYNRTYNFIGLNQVSQLHFRQDKLP